MSINEIRGSASGKMFTEMFIITKRGRVLGTYYPGPTGLVNSLLKSIVSLNKATKVLVNLPYGINGDKLTENPLGEVLCMKCGGVERVVEHWEDGEKVMVCEYCLGLRKKT